MMNYKHLLLPIAFAAPIFCTAQEDYPPELEGHKVAWASNPPQNIIKIVQRPDNTVDTFELQDAPGNDNPSIASFDGIPTSVIRSNNMDDFKAQKAELEKLITKTIQSLPKNIQNAVAQIQLNNVIVDTKGSINYADILYINPSGKFFSAKMSGDNKFGQNINNSNEMYVIHQALYAVILNYQNQALNPKMVPLVNFNVLAVAGLQSINFMLEEVGNENEQKVLIINPDGNTEKRKVIKLK